MANFLSNLFKAVGQIPQAIGKFTYEAGIPNEFATAYANKQENDLKQQYYALGRAKLAAELREQELKNQINYNTVGRLLPQMEYDSKDHYIANFTNPLSQKQPTMEDKQNKMFSDILLGNKTEQTPNFVPKMDNQLSFNGYKPWINEEIKTTVPNPNYKEPVMKIIPQTTTQSQEYGYKDIKSFADAGNDPDLDNLDPRTAKAGSLLLDHLNSNGINAKISSVEQSNEPKTIETISTKSTPQFFSNVFEKKPNIEFRPKLQEHELVNKYRPVYAWGNSFGAEEIDQMALNPQEFKVRALMKAGLMPTANEQQKYELDVIKTRTEGLNKLFNSLLEVGNKNAQNGASPELAQQQQSILETIAASIPGVNPKGLNLKVNPRTGFRELEVNIKAFSAQSTAQHQRTMEQISMYNAQLRAQEVEWSVREKAKRIEALALKMKADSTPTLEDTKEAEDILFKGDGTNKNDGIMKQISKATTLEEKYELYEQHKDSIAKAYRIAYASKGPEYADNKMREDLIKYDVIDSKAYKQRNVWRPTPDSDYEALLH